MVVNDGGIAEEDVPSDDERMSEDEDEDDDDAEDEEEEVLDSEGEEEGLKRKRVTTEHRCERLHSGRPYLPHSSVPNLQAQATT